MGQQKVKELRNQKGWSQSDLSSLSGLSVKTIQRIEKCQGTPSMDSAKALAAVFERDFAEFIPSAETSAERGSDIVAVGATVSSPQSADVPVNFFSTARSYWQPAVIAVFMAATIGFLAKLYVNVERLTADVSDLLTMRNTELASLPSRGSISTAANTQSNKRSSANYNGDLALKYAFQTSDVANEKAFVNLLEIVKPVHTVEIVATWEDTAAIESDLSSLMILRNY